MKKIFLIVFSIVLFGSILFANEDDGVKVATPEDTLRYYEDRIKLYEIDKFGSNTNNSMFYKSADSHH
jgi:hypothetical protein